MSGRGYETSNVGVSRNLTEVFCLLRTNSQQHRVLHTSSVERKGGADERMRLISLEEGEGDPGEPSWIHSCDEIEFEFERLRTRLGELSVAQQKHISRPNFGDDLFEREEKAMEAMTEQVTSMLTHCQRMIRMMTSQVESNEKSTGRKLRENAISSLVLSLTNLADQFRTGQSKYLIDIKRRTRDVDDFLVTTSVTSTADDVNWGELVDITPSQEYSMDQIQQIMVSDKEVKDREKEVLAVNSSIRDLNSLFQDLSSMVVNQGTILDRIDYNIEQTSIRVGSAVQSVKKAERYQSGDKKMHCIFCLAVSIVFVLMLIVFTKF